MENFERIVRDIESSFLMENLKLSDKTVIDMKDIYKKKLKKGRVLLKRRKVVKYDTSRK